MQRLISFDIAKALCIILVVIGHYIPDNSPQWYVNLRTWIYSFHMPLFMFASGYIYMAFKKDESYWTFVTKKIRRLMIPYFVVSVIIITIKFLTQSSMYVENPVTAMSYIHVFYLPEAGYFLWFIWALFTMFLIVPLFKTKVSRIVLFVVSIALHYLPLETTNLFAIDKTIKMLVFFMLGVCLVDCNIASISKYANKYILYTICSLIVILFILASIQFHNYGYIVEPILPWLGIASVMIISIFISKHVDGTLLNVVMIISASNYIIYLFHTTFEGFAKAALHKINIKIFNDNLSFVVGAVIVILSGIICPILLHRFVLQKTPFLKKMFGLK